MRESQEVRILLVDDESDLLEISKLMLEREQGFQVIAVQSAQEALQMVRSSSFDAMVSDYQMPGMDGIELLKTIRSMDASLPFILFTGRGREEVVIEALNGGATFYLQKGGDAASLYLELSQKIRVAVQRNRMEKLAQESEERTRLYLENMPESFFVANPEGRYVEINRAACEMLGYTKEELLNMDLLSLVPREKVDVARSNFSTMKKNGHLRAEGVMVRKDGSLVNVLLNAVRLPNGNGMAFITNISDLKKAEESLRMKSEELDRYFSSSLDLLCIADTDGHFRRLNPEWEKVLGYPLSELEGRAYLDLVHPDDKARTQGALDALSRGESLFNFVNRYRCRDGSYKWLEWNSFPSGGTIYAVARDISDRLRIEEKLKNELALNNAILDTAKAIIIVIDPSGRIVMFNRHCEMVSGYSASEALGRHVWDFLLLPEEADRTKAAFKSLVDHKPLEYFENFWVRKDGSLRRLAWSSTPIIDAAGRTEAIVGIALDITEQRRLTEEIVYSNSLLNATLESIADGVLVIDRVGRVASYNRRFLEMWNIPPAVARARDDTLLLDHVQGMLRDPDEFLSKVKYLYEHPEEQTKDRVEFRDGRTFARFSRPQMINEQVVGRVWSFLDITRMVEDDKLIRRTLQEVQEKGEEIQSQSEEIQSQSEEIQAQNEELRAQSDELRGALDQMAWANQLLGESEEKLRAFIDQSFEGMVIFDTEELS